MRKKKIDIFDLLPAEANQKVDEFGYKFLAAQGYDTTDCATDETRRDALNAVLKRDKCTLRYHGVVDPDNQSIRILIWFSLDRKEGRKWVEVARSGGIRFVTKPHQEVSDEQHNEEDGQE